MKKIETNMKIAETCVYFLYLLQSQDGVMRGVEEEAKYLYTTQTLIMGGDFRTNEFSPNDDGPI